MDIKKYFLIFMLSLPLYTIGMHEHVQEPTSEEAKNGDHAHEMLGMYGQYAATRESSGTSWQPESTSMPSIHKMHGATQYMLQGFADLVYDKQRGPRGDQMLFSENMFMFDVWKKYDPGTIGFRAMLSLEPATIGCYGYPLLLQTGETCNGVTSLIDRQHPHDLFMELAVTANVAIKESSSVFVYFGLPGEPALGPPVFMQRFTGMFNPEAPISHHWLDSTHITYGVITCGCIVDCFKLEYSAFRGREPDQHRFDIERPGLDSHAFRISANPTDNIAMQLSYGILFSPEQLHPEVNTNRLTLSCMYNKPWENNNWQTMLAWGRNINKPGPTLDAILLETALYYNHEHIFFGRFERVSKDDLCCNNDCVFTVKKVSFGYSHSFETSASQITVNLGAVGSFSLVPPALKPSYGGTPFSFMLFTQIMLG